MRLGSLTGASEKVDDLPQLERLLGGLARDIRR